GIVEVDGALVELFADRPGQRIDVDFQSGRECRAGGEARTNTTVRRAFDRLMELERVSPEGFVAERVEPERLPALLDPGRHAEVLRDDYRSFPVRTLRPADGKRPRHEEHDPRNHEPPRWPCHQTSSRRLNCLASDTRP